MRTLLLTLTLSAFTLTAFAAPGEEQQVKDAEKSWATAVMKGDYAKLESLLTPDLIYAHSTGIIDDKTQYIGKMKSGKQKYVGIEHGDLTIRLHGDSAIAHSKVRMHGTNSEGPFDDRLMMIHVWVKSQGKWLLAGHQTTRLR